MSDPLRLVWDALARGGYGPHGKEDDFRARCPGHDGDNRDALHVSDDGDGNALLYCFAHDCRAERIVAALGLGLRDLFRAGHPRSHRRHLHEARRSEFAGGARLAANTLLALSQLGVCYRVEITTDCSYCGSPNASLTVDTHFPYVLLQCAAGCSERMFTEALAGNVADKRKEVA